MIDSPKPLFESRQNLATPGAIQALATAQVEALGHEIAILGMRGLDINDPAKKYTLKTLLGDFSGRHLVSLMHAAFQKTDPGTDVGIDLSREYAQAVAMFGSR